MRGSLTSPCCGVAFRFAKKSLSTLVAHAIQNNGQIDSGELDNACVVDCSRNKLAQDKRAPLLLNPKCGGWRETRLLSLGQELLATFRQTQIVAFAKRGVAWWWGRAEGRGGSLARKTDRGMAHNHFTVRIWGLVATIWWRLLAGRGREDETASVASRVGNPARAPLSTHSARRRRADRLASVGLRSVLRRERRGRKITESELGFTGLGGERGGCS